MNTLSCTSPVEKNINVSFKKCRLIRNVYMRPFCLKFQKAPVIKKRTSERSDPKQILYFFKTPRRDNSHQPFVITGLDQQLYFLFKRNFL